MMYTLFCSLQCHKNRIPVSLLNQEIVNRNMFISVQDKKNKTKRRPTGEFQHLTHVVYIRALPTVTSQYHECVYCIWHPHNCSDRKVFLHHTNVDGSSFKEGVELIENNICSQEGPYLKPVQASHLLLMSRFRHQLCIVHIHTH